MRINLNSIPTPKPMARDLGFEGLEDGNKVVEDVLGGVIDQWTWSFNTSSPFDWITQL